MSVIRVVAVQAALDVVGHYNRPDVFTMLIDERPREPFSGV